MSSSLPDSYWEEANAFLARLGYSGNVLQRPEFRKDALKFLDLLLQKNQELNLTGAKDLESVFWKHLLDSLAILSFEPLGHVADWGSGGGMPGIPLALARKHSKDASPVYFVDSIAKKVRAVEEFAAALDLSNTNGLIGRGEELIKKNKLNGVKTIVMRAVAPPERAVDWLSDKISNWVFFIGPNQRSGWQQQALGLKKKSLYIAEEKKFDLPRNLGERWLLRISKSST